MKTLVLRFATLAVLLLLSSRAVAFNHPAVPGTLADLEAIKAKVLAGEEPWASGYGAMANDWTSALNYSKRGAEAVVTRNPNSTNLTAKWRPDMTAAYNQARMWYFTGNPAYAQKARDILIDWATVQTTFGGTEGNLDLGDYAYKFVGAADILRGTWPGWTQDDTDKVKAWLTNVYWPVLGMDGSWLGPTNKGLLSLVAGAAIAVFCDDQAKLDRVIYHLRYSAATGFVNTLSNGEHGETGRDEGHSYNHIFAMAQVANILWNIGIDAFSYSDNRLLAMGEYYARENLLEPVVFVPMGTTDEYYGSNWGTPGFVGNASAFNILKSAYGVRRGMRSPFMERKLTGQPSSDMDAFMWLRPQDASTATPLAQGIFPSVSPVGAGMTSTSIGTATPAGSGSYNSSTGVWTVTGAGSEIWTHGADSFHFVHRQVSGDFSIIVKVESVLSNSTKSKAGIMVRSDLNADPGSKIWVARTSEGQIESYMDGWTAVYGGSNWEKQSYWSGSKWLKIERVGNIITAYASPDGTSWANQVYGQFSNMPNTVYLGMATCALTNTTGTSTFSNLNITGGSGGKIQIPEAPECLLASPGQEVTLRWTGSFGATGYNVKRATAAGGPYTTIATGVTFPSYLDTTVVPDTPYYYVVTGSNSAGEGQASAEEPVVPRKDCVNLTYGGASSSSGGNAGSAFDKNCASAWTAGATTGTLQYDFGGNPRIVTAYDIINTNGNYAANPKDWQFQGSNGGGVWTTLDTRAGEVFKEIFYYPRRFYTNNATAYRYYRLNITANNGGTGVQLSEFALLGWADEVPAAPTSLNAMPVSTSRIDLAWAAVSGAASYEILRGASAAGPFSVVAGGVTGTTYSVQGLGPGTAYYHVVRAVSPRGTGPQSAVAGATTAAMAGSAISIDFQGGSASNGTPAVMGASEVAGVVSLSNWNGASGASGSLSALKDYSGAATTAAVAWASNNPWSIPITEAAGNARMMKGYLDTSETSVTTVTISGLPAAFASGGYDVYVYTDGDNGTTAKTGRYTIGGTQITATDGASANYSGTFVQATNSSGNHVRFSGVTGASFTLSAQAVSSRAPVNGIQIVAAATYTPSESWRFANFGAIANTGDAADTADPDGDGWSNLQEFESGTDPNNSSSLLKVSSLQGSGQDVVIAFPTVSGKSYRIEKSESLLDGSWQTVADPVAGTGASVEVVDEGARLQPRWFYRIKVLP